MALLSLQSGFGSEPVFHIVTMDGPVDFKVLVSSNSHGLCRWLECKRGGYWMSRVTIAGFGGGF